MIPFSHKREFDDNDDNDNNNDKLMTRSFTSRALHILRRHGKDQLLTKHTTSPKLDSINTNFSILLSFPASRPGLILHFLLVSLLQGIYEYLRYPLHWNLSFLQNGYRSSLRKHFKVFRSYFLEQMVQRCFIFTVLIFDIIV